MNKILTFLNLLDFEGRLSLTNVAFFVLLVRVTFFPHVTFPEIAALFISVLNYAHKRFEQAKTPNQTDVDLQPLVEEIEKLKDRVGTLQLAKAYGTKFNGDRNAV